MSKTIKSRRGGQVTSTTDNQSQAFQGTSVASPRDTPNVNNEVGKNVKEPQAQTVVFSNITLKRDFSSQEWRLTVSDAKKHLMSTSFTSPRGGALFKFMTNGDIMGGTDFPSGVAKENDPSIYVSEGYWSVTFNVVDGSYAFTEKNKSNQSSSTNSKNRASVSTSAPKMESDPPRKGYASNSSDEYIVYMRRVHNRSAVVKAIAVNTGLSEGAACKIVNSVPSVVLDKLSKKTAEALAEVLTRAGADVKVIWQK